MPSAVKREAQSPNVRHKRLALNDLSVSNLELSVY